MNFSLNPAPYELKYETSTPTLKRKYSFSKQHLSAAILFAAEAHHLETAPTTAEPPDEIYLARHQACVTATILSAAAFLESSIKRAIQIGDRWRARKPSDGAFQRS